MAERAPFGELKRKDGYRRCFDNKVKHQNKITSQLLQEPEDREREVDEVCIRS